MRRSLRNLVLPALLSAIAVPLANATTTALPWWMAITTYTPQTTTAITAPQISTTTQTQINNGFNGTGTPTEPILGTTTVVTTPTTTVQTTAVVTPSPAPVQRTSTSLPWWSAFTTYNTAPVVTTPVYTPTVQTPTSFQNAITVTRPMTQPIIADAANPEPSTVILLGAGLGAIIFYRRRAARKALST